jgi:hypothetical protein
LDGNRKEEKSIHGQGSLATYAVKNFSIHKSSCLVIVRHIESRPINSFTDVLKQVLHRSNPNRYLNIDVAGVSQRKEPIIWYDMLIGKGMAVFYKTLIVVAASVFWICVLNKSSNIIEGTWQLTLAPSVNPAWFSWIAGPM